MASLYSEKMEDRTSGRKRKLQRFLSQRRDEPSFDSGFEWFSIMEVFFDENGPSEDSDNIPKENHPTHDPQPKEPSILCSNET